MAKRDDKKLATKNYTDKKTEDTEDSVTSVVARIRELEAQVKRTLADYQNLEKRVQNERYEWIKSANKELLLRILPVLDTLTLVAQHVDDTSLKVSIKQFEDVLTSEGVTKIDAVGKDFDPATMECVTTADGEDNKVLEEIRTGYMLGDKVLRPAQVKVGKEVN